MMEATPQQLLELIGAQQVEIALLRGRLRELELDRIETEESEPSKDEPAMEYDR